MPADDPNVVVRRTKISDHSYTIDCVGNQVLFIEFGAGRHEYTRTRTVGIVDEKETELAPRPAGITHIGGYGQRKGNDDYWFYNSVSGRESDNNRYVRTSKAGLQAMITIGIRPHRALWRARNVALKKLYRRLGKL